MKKFFILMILWPSLSMAEKWELNDVTYILPLPNSITRNSYIKSTTRDELTGAPLIKESVYNTATDGQGLAPTSKGPIPQTDRAIYLGLFALAFRVDPCFKINFIDQCRHQIRIVWQPVVDTEKTEPSAVDASFHTFYDLDTVHFNRLLLKLEKIKRGYGISTENLPLMVHPGFSNKEATPFFQDFIRLMKTAVSSAKLSRVASMELGAPDAWFFRAFDIEGSNSLVKFKIFRIPKSEIDPFVLTTSNGEIEQDANHAQEGDFFSDTILDPLLPHESGDQLFKLLSNSKVIVQSNNDKELRHYLKSSLAIENPERHLPGTIDCVSCHTATSVKVWTARRLGLQSLPDDFRTSSLSKFYNLKNISPKYGTTISRRSLGYADRDLQISDRTINESAKVAEALSRSP